MFELFQDYKGSLLVNGKEYKSIEEAENAFKNKNTGLTIILNPNGKEVNMGGKIDSNSPTSENSIYKKNTVYKISVMAYMTNYAPDFFLKTAPNIANERPMPYRSMVGIVLQETPKLVKMELMADITQSRYTKCMKCGRPISDKTLQNFGVGAECDDTYYEKVFKSEKEINDCVEKYRKKLNQIKWTGWIVKSAITEIIELPNYRW